jgi:hypothetical protein
MGLFSRLRGRHRRGKPLAPARADRGKASAYLEQFVRARTGVEGFIEPATTVTPTTLLLVAEDGEWTRRAVPDAATALGFGRKLSIPVYDVNLSGYPQRMRDYNARKKAEGSL